MGEAVPQGPGQRDTREGWRHGEAAPDGFLRPRQAGTSCPWGHHSLAWESPGPLRHFHRGGRDVLGLPHSRFHLPTAPHSRLAPQSLPSDHLFDPETSPSSSPCPRPPEPSQASARVSETQAVPAVARPRRRRHKLASSSSSEDEDSTGPPRPTQKRPRHSAPVQRARAWMVGPISRRETVAAGRADYWAAIQGVGSGQSCHLRPGPPRGPGEAPTPQAALIPEEECLAGAWLEDDMLLSQGRRPLHPQSSGYRTKHSASSSGTNESPVRPRSQARQSRLSSLKSWNAAVRAGGDCSSATELPRSPDIPSGDNPVTSHLLVGS